MSSRGAGVEVSNESGEAVDEGRLVGLARHVLAEMGVHPQAELSVRLVDVGEMARLHRQWMDEPGPTDVLAFPMDELEPFDVRGGPGGDDEYAHPALLGDVVLCPEVARRQAGTAGHDTGEELALLCAHGVLHLLGFDHADPAGEQEMFGVQSRLLRGWRARRTGTAPSGSGEAGAP